MTLTENWVLSILVLEVAASSGKEPAWQKKLSRKGVLGLMAGSPFVGVPLIDIKALDKKIQGEIETAVLRVLNSGQAIMGPDVEAFEKGISRYCGTNYGVSCNSGSDALLLALHAMGIGPGDEVILPPFTFFATAGAVCRTGATPVFADIDPVTFNIDPAQIENKITSRTKAIIPVHLFGQCAEMETIWGIADRHNLLVLEDAAQSLAAEYQGKRSGNLGAMACLSFYPTKNLGAFGEGGMVVTNDEEWAAKLRCLRVHGMEPRYYHKYMGWNARMDAIQAAICMAKLPYLDSWVKKRQEAAARYDFLLSEECLGFFLKKPAVAAKRLHAFNQYVVRVAGDERDALVSHLRSEKIGCEIYYPWPLHLQECLQFLGYGAGDFPATEKACAEVLALPIFPEITMEQQRRVIASCASYFRKSASKAA